MAITTYTELQTAVERWTDRSDLTAYIPDFISLLEARLNRVLRVRQQMMVSELSPTDGEATLPTDYLEWRRVTWMGTPRRELAYVEPGYAQALNTSQESGLPNYFTIEGSTLKVTPIDDTEIEFLYYKKIPALSSATTAASTNWLLTAHPDVYLFGTLVESLAFASNDMGAVWQARLDNALAEVKRLSEMSRGQAQIRPVGPVV